MQQQKQRSDGLLDHRMSSNQQAHDDDEVVAEFDVYLAGQLKDDLHLLQYPLRPSYRAYGDQGQLFKVEMSSGVKVTA